MKKIKDLISPEVAKNLSTSANLRYGTVIYRRGGVEIIEATDEKI